MGGGVQGLARTAAWFRDSVAEPVLTVLFPPRCVGCGDFESYLCDACRLTLRPVGADSCPRCGEPGHRALVKGRCVRCVGQGLPFAGARAAFVHQGVARQLVAEFKFRGQPVLGRLMADLARPAFTGFVRDIEPRGRLVVTWVPSHPRIQRERGYNQAEVLARRLATGAQLPVRGDLVYKAAATRHQKGLGRAGRQENLKGVFALHERTAARVPEQVEAVVLVDDVYTTGATAKEVSSVLSLGIGLPVYVFTFSRAVAGSSERHD